MSGGRTSRIEALRVALGVLVVGGLSLLIGTASGFACEARPLPTRPFGPLWSRLGFAGVLFALSRRFGSTRWQVALLVIVVVLAFAPPLDSACHG